METAWSVVLVVWFCLWLASIPAFVVVVVLEESGLDRDVAAYIRRRLNGP